MKKKNQKTYRVGDPNPMHPEQKLLTRRDFLSSGVLGFSGGLVMPTVLDLLIMKQAQADGCPAGGAAPGVIPFIVFDCAGGASLPGNFVVGSRETRPDGQTFAADAASASPVEADQFWNSGGSPAQHSQTKAFADAFTPLNRYDTLGLIDYNAFDLDFRYGVPLARTRNRVSLTARFTPANNAGAGTSQTINNPTDNIQSQFLVALNDTVSDGTSKAWTDSTGAAIPTTFNTPPAANPGTPNFQQYLRMGAICHTSLSDSGTNKLSAVSMVTAAGSVGNRIRVGLGTRVSNSAGNSDVANLNSNYRPMGITSVNSLATALGYGPAFTSLSQGVRESVAKALIKLTGTQARSFASMNLGQQLGTLAECGYIKNQDYTGAGSALSAANSPEAVQAFAGTNLNNNAQENLIATLMYAALSGASGPAVITIGGCDYHTGARAAGEAKDAELGRRLGQAVQMAGLLNKPFAFQIFTDGGISSGTGNRNWMGDDNNHSLTIFGVFDPSGPRDMIATQISSYTPGGPSTVGQAADRNHFVGSEPSLVAATVLLNYLAVTGQRAQFSKTVNSTTNFPEATLKKLLMFKDKA